MHRFRLGAAAAVLFVVLVVTVPAAVASSAQRGSISVSPGAGAQIHKLGAVNLRSLGRQGASQVRRDTPGTLKFLLWSRESPGGGVGSQAALQPPTAPGFPVVRNAAAGGFEGIFHAEQAFASGVELEPPDQGLCVGAFSGTNFVFESVNLALKLFDTNANQYTPAIDLAALYGLPPAFDAATNRFGPFLSDPKCYYDPDTGHWFHTVLEIDTDPATGDLSSHAATLVAASATGDPLGAYNIYAIDATDAAHPHCPCFGDQPLLGADAYGLYVGTSEYSLDPFGAFANGAQLYALDKRALEAGTTPKVVHIATGTTLTATVQPAIAPSGRYEAAGGGTEYFMSGFDCLPPDCHINPGLGNRIMVWALTNTRSLRTATPSVQLTSTTLRSETYGQPVPQVQRPGPRPLGDSLGEPLPLVEANDTRMNQVVFAAGRLWSGLNTIVNPGPRDGIAWFQVRPSVVSSGVQATIATQGYVAARNAFVSFPSIGVNDAGRGVISYSVMGPSYFPSAAWTAIENGGTSPSVRIARAGFRPEDGASCYPEFYPPGTPTPVLCRWGDYSASIALPSGEIWSGAEFIGDNPRTTLANWSTFLWPVSR